MGLPWLLWTWIIFNITFFMGKKIWGFHVLRVITCLQFFCCFLWLYFKLWGQWKSVPNFLFIEQPKKGSIFENSASILHTTFFPLRINCSKQCGIMYEFVNIRIWKLKWAWFYVNHNNSNWGVIVIGAVSHRKVENFSMMVQLDSILHVAVHQVLYYVLISSIVQTIERHY